MDNDAKETGAPPIDDGTTDDLPESDLDGVSGGRGSAKPLNPQPLPP